MRVPREWISVPPQSVALEKVLFVEGDTPSHFFEAMAMHLGIADQIEIWNYGGINQLGVYLRTLASTAEFRNKVKSLGITRDAENDPNAARQSVESAVKSAGLSGQVSVSIAILPNKKPGMIETLCVEAISSHPSFACIESFFASLKENQIKLPDGITIAKHQAQAYPIARDYPQLMPGLAAYKKVWPFDAQAFNYLLAFLAGL